MRILVIGGAGYIGSVIVEELIPPPVMKRPFMILSCARHIDAVHPQARLVRGDYPSARVADPDDA